MAEWRRRGLYQPSMNSKTAIRAPPTGLPVLPPSPSSMRAAATTPAEPAGAVVRFPADGSLPRETGGSASALSVSRPARRLLALRPAWSLSRPRRPFCRSASDDVVTSIIRSDCYRLERHLAGRDSHPLGMVPFHGTQPHDDRKTPWSYAGADDGPLCPPRARFHSDGGRTDHWEHWGKPAGPASRTRGPVGELSHADVEETWRGHGLSSNASPSVAGWSAAATALNCV